MIFDARYNASGSVTTLRPLLRAGVHGHTYHAAIFVLEIPESRCRRQDSHHWLVCTTSGDHLLVQDSSRLSIDISRILSRNTAASCCMLSSAVSKACGMLLGFGSAAACQLRFLLDASMRPLGASEYIIYIYIYIHIYIYICIVYIRLQIYLNIYIYIYT